MLRRSFLRVLVPASLAPKLLLAQQGKGPAPPPPAPVPWTLGLNPATPLPHTVGAEEIAAGELRFFSQTQMGTLTRLADLLLPSMGGRPGSLQAGAPAFLDFLIGSSPANRKSVYVGGLDWLDGEAKRQYQRGFAQLSEEEAGAVVKPWLRAWMSDHPPQEEHADFVNIAHADIRMATINSRAWSAVPATGATESTPVALYWQPIEPVVFGDRGVCAATTPAVIAAPKSEHTVPAYPR